jgi:hypothetical protein
VTAKQVEARVLLPHLFQTRKLCPKRSKEEYARGWEGWRRLDGEDEAGGAGGGEQSRLLRLMRTCVHSVKKGELTARCVLTQILPVTRVCVPIPPMQVPTCRAIRMFMLKPDKAAMPSRKTACILRAMPVNLLLHHTRVSLSSHTEMWLQET